MKTVDPDPNAVPHEDVKRLLDEVVNCDMQAAEYLVDRAEMIRAAKAKGLHTSAFGLATRLHRMPAHKRQSFLDCFDAYREALELDLTPQLDVLRNSRDGERVG